MKFVGIRNGNYAVYFAASSWNEAQSICNKNMWHLDGRLMFALPAFLVGTSLPNLIIWMLGGMK
jgi:hypothetical protein